jgi:hypothetical protein
MLVLIGKSGRAVWLDEKHHGHITAHVCLALERFARVRGAIGEGSGRRHDTLEQWLSETSQEYPR